MTELIKSQAFDVGVMFGCGLLLAALAQLVNGYQRWRRPRTVICLIQDLLYWFLSGLFAAAFLYYCSYGKLSVHAFLSLAAGALFWRLLLGNKLKALIFAALPPRKGCDIMKYQGRRRV